MRLSRMPVVRGFQLQVMSPLGSYPRKSIILKNAALIISPKLCFSIIRISRRDWSLSEVDLLSARQIPFLGSILLANVGYPYPMQSVSAHEDDPEISPRCVSRCRALLIRQLPAYLSGSAYLHRPPALGGPEYRFHDAGDFGDSTAVVSDWLKLVNRQDAVFLRGLGALLKAHMAWGHREFGDAACIYLWIALDAAHSITLRRLKEEKGLRNPTSQDAAQYFDEITGEKSMWMKFFQSDYENRIRAIHPDNRFGAEAHPQFLADDFYELNELLTPYFRFLLTGVYESPYSHHEN